MGTSAHANIPTPGLANFNCQGYCNSCPLSFLHSPIKDNSDIRWLLKILYIHIYCSNIIAIEVAHTHVANMEISGLVLVTTMKLDSPEITFTQIAYNCRCRYGLCCHCCCCSWCACVWCCEPCDGWDNCCDASRAVISVALPKLFG